MKDPSPRLRVSFPAVNAAPAAPTSAPRLMPTARGSLTRRIEQAVTGAFECTHGCRHHLGPVVVRAHPHCRIRLHPSDDGRGRRGEQAITACIETGGAFLDRVVLA